MPSKMPNTAAENMSHYAVQLSHAGELGACDEAQSEIPKDVLETMKFLMYRWTVRTPARTQASTLTTP